MIIIHYFFAEIIHPLFFINKLNNEIMYPFLPLLSLSCIGAIQLLVIWYHTFILIITNENNIENNIEKNK